jgi:hypothetical protein
MGIYECYFLCFRFFDVEIIEKVFNITNAVNLPISLIFYLLLDDRI